MARRKQQFGILIGCILLAAVLWGYVTLTRIYENDVEIPLIVEPPPNQALLSTIPSSVTIRIRGTGLQIINLQYLSERIECRMDLAMLRPHSQSVYNVDKDDIIRSIPMPSSVRVVSVTPTDITMSTGDMTSKRVPVELRTNISTRDGFIMVRPPRPDPEFVMVRGSKNVIDGIKRWPSTKLSLEDLYESVDAEVLMSDSLMTVLNVVPSTVKVRLDIQQTATVEIENVPIENSPGTEQTHILYPSKVKIIVKSGVDIASNLTPADFSAKIPNNARGIVQPIITAPDGVTVIGVEPRFVHVVINEASP